MAAAVASEILQNNVPAPWAKNYIGIPFVDRGRDHAGVDCYGLVWMVYREQLGIELPSSNDDYPSAKDRDRLLAIIGAELSTGHWQRVEDDQRQAGDAVLILPAHIGVLISRDRFLHIDGNRHANSCVQRLDCQEWRLRRKSYWRYGLAADGPATAQNVPAVAARVLVPDICSETVTVSAIIAPFTTMRETTELPAGLTLHQIMRELGWNGRFHARVFIGDAQVPEHLYERVKPKAGQCVTIRVTPGFPLLIPIIIAAAQAAAAAAASATAAGAAVAATLGVSTATLGAIAAATVGLAGALLMKALCPPPTPKPPKLSGTPAQFSISGDTNVLAPFSVFGRVFGVRKITPQQGSAPYNQAVSSYKAGTNEIIGSNQYLRQVFIFGPGPLDISQIKIGDSLIETFEDVQWETRAGYLDDGPLTLYTDDIAQDAINVLLIQAPTPPAIIGYGWQQQTSGTQADELKVDLTFPDGLYAIGAGNGSHNWAALVIQIRYAPTGTTSWINRPKMSVRRVSSQQVMVSDRWEVARGQYDVQIQIVPASVTVYPGGYALGSNNPFFITCFWTALSTIRNQAPYQLPGLATLAVRIRATNQLNGPITNLNCIASSILPDYDGVSSWEHYAGSWSYDWDNTGAGASSYALDTADPHTADARSGANWIVGEAYGTGAGTAGPYADTLGSLPVQPGSLSISTGVVPLIDDGLGSIYADPGAMPNYNPGGTYQASETTRYNGKCYISLLGGNLGHPPDSSPTEWALILTAGTINYASGACSVTFGSGLCAPSGAALLANYQEQLFASGGGRDQAITTASGSDGAAVCGKSIMVHQDPLDGETGLKADAPIAYTVSGWYRASAPISAGIKLAVYFSQTEDFSIGEIVSADTVIVLANGAATTGWQQCSAVVNAPAPPVLDAGGGKESYYMRVAVYHNPDGVGGVTVYWDDISVVRANSEQQAVNLLPNPSFDYPGNITSNPASHYREVMQGSSNKQPVTDDRLDLSALEAWHADCAATARFNNMILDTQSTVFETLKTICAMGRASFWMNDGLYSMLRDEPQTTPVQHFTPRNSGGFRSTRALPDLPGMLKVRFVNPSANWQADERWVYDDGYSASTPGLLTESLDLTHGCTDPDQAWREGRYHLAVGRLRPEVYELNVDFENLTTTRGDLVQVAHDVTQWGLGTCRIKAVQTTSGGTVVTGFTGDEAFTLEYGSSYNVRIRCRDGSSLLAPINNPALPDGDYTDVTFVFTTAVSSGALPAAEDLVMFGLVDQESAQLIVTKIATSSDLNAKLELQDYAPAIYTADSGTPPPFNYGTIPPVTGGGGQTADASIPPPAIVSLQSSKDSNPLDSGGGQQLMITIGLSQPVGPNGNALPAANFSGVQVQHRVDPLDGTTNDAANYNSGDSYIAGDTVTDSTGNIWIANEAVPAGNAPGSSDGSGNAYWSLVDFAGDWSAIAIQPYGTQCTAAPIELGHLYDIQVRYVLADGTTTGWTQDEILCEGTSTIDSLLDGVNFRRLSSTNQLALFIYTPPLVIPGSGAKTYVGSVALTLTNASAPLLLSINLKLASAVDEKFGLHVCEDTYSTGVYSAASQILGAILETSGASGSGSFAGYAFPLASLGLGQHTFDFYLNTTSGNARTITGVPTLAIG